MAAALVQLILALTFFKCGPLIFTKFYMISHCGLAVNYPVNLPHLFSPMVQPLLLLCFRYLIVIRERDD